MVKKYIALFLFFFFTSLMSFGQKEETIKWNVEFPDIVVSQTQSKIKLSAEYDGAPSYLKNNYSTVLINGIAQPVEWDVFSGTVKFPVPNNKSLLTLEIGGQTFKKIINPIPLWLSFLPPLIAILLALVFREVISALFIGIFTGASIIGFYASGFGGMFLGFLHIIDRYIMNALDNWSHIAVIVFSMTIGAVVSIISKNGGMRGVVNRLEPYAHNPRSGQFVIWLMGILIFFDDYANTLVVGNTMRPVADRLNISREKLAYLVDSTAAPVAAIAFVTTWIGAELGYIESGLVEIPQITDTPYTVFLNSLSFSFYPIFTLIFMLILIGKQKDFGPMAVAELKARNNVDSDKTIDDIQEDRLSEFNMKKGVTPRSYNAVIPILVIIFGVIAGMLATGYNSEIWNDQSLSFFRKLSSTIGAADSFTALLWASVSGATVAVLMTISQKIMTLEQTISAGLHGFKTMIPPMIILILAWSLALITEDMHTAVFLQGLWSDSFSPIFMPAVIFILSALVSFSTGSSWGTMAILYPLLLPAAYHISVESGMEHHQAIIIFYNVVSVILAGSVFGDHCSPISDTTILSSLASSCNHIDHVRTQLPYAITTAFVAIIFGTLPASYGISPLILYPAGIAAMFLIIHFMGKKTA